MTNIYTISRAQLVCEEFTNQVKAEKELSLPFAPHMDNLDTPQAIAKLQVSFSDYVVSPLWTVVGDLIPDMKVCVENLKLNREQWLKEASS